VITLIATALGISAESGNTPARSQRHDTQPADEIPANGLDPGSYEVIHLGGQAAVVVPVSDVLRLRALEQAALPPRPPPVATPVR
jgi:hypothetical protein